MNRKKLLNNVSLHRKNVYPSTSHLLGYVCSDNSNCFAWDCFLKNSNIFGVSQISEGNFEIQWNSRTQGENFFRKNLICHDLSVSTAAKRIQTKRKKEKKNANHNKVIYSKHCFDPLFVAFIKNKIYLKVI